MSIGRDGIHIIISERTPHEEMKMRVMQRYGFARSSRRRIILDAKAESGK